MSPLAGPGRLAGVHRDAATDAAHLAASFCFAHFGISHKWHTPAASYLRVLNWGMLPLLLYAGTRRYLQV